MKVMNNYGTEIEWNTAVNLMDDDLREELSADLAPCTEQEFFEAYAKAHETKFCEEWELAKENPCY